MFLLLPGRHHIFTEFQFKYLHTILNIGLEKADDVSKNPLKIKEPIDGVIFAVTSANHSGTKRNPIPFYLRSILVQSFCQNLSVPAFTFGIDDVGMVDDFASYTLKQIKHQSEGHFDLDPENTIVICATPVLKMYQALGFKILPAELKDLNPHVYKTPLPWHWVEQIGQDDDFTKNHEIVSNIHHSSLEIWKNYRLANKVRRILNDPIIGDDGDITESRDYNTYVRQMDEIAELKYAETAPFILSGNIGDIGCAVGSWIKLASEDDRFFESDFYGIEVARQLFNICLQRKENKAFNNPNVFFSQKNAVTELVFEETSMNTIHTSSLTHEIASYGSIEDLEHFIANRHRELERGGVWINRDVIGPINGDKKVLLQLAKDDGRNADFDQQINDQFELKHYLDGLSTACRFRRFVMDFRKEENDQISFSFEEHNRLELISIKYSDACEYLLTKDYTDNWKSEMHERFCFWSFEDWKAQLEKVGFELLPGSSAYTNPWIVENRISKKATIYELTDDQKLLTLPTFPTNALIVARKK